MTAISAREGYPLWAPSYERETVVSLLERRAVDALGVPTAGRRLLDVGCGTARRLRDADAAERVGLDLVPEMLARDASRTAPSHLALAAADVRTLPLASASADVVWCRLVLGHVRDVHAAYAELARVCAAGGTVVASDLCAEAVAAGHRRTFRDRAGVVRELEHFVHTVDAHVAAARGAGLALVGARTLTIDAGVRELYADAGRLDAWEAQRGLPLVVALAFRAAA